MNPRHQDDNRSGVTEFFKLNDGRILCNTLNIPYDDSKFVSYWATLSENDGKTYNILESYPDNIYTGSIVKKALVSFRVKSNLLAMPVIEMDLADASVDAISLQFSARYNALWDINSKKLKYILLPDLSVSEHYSFKGYVSNMIIGQRFSYYYGEIGLFRIENEKFKTFSW